MALPREHLLDELATAYVQVVAAVAGATIAKGRDYGVDGTLRQIRESRPGIFAESGIAVDFQVKATAIRRPSLDFIDFDLRVRNYNAIVTRHRHLAPLFLFLICFEEESDLIEMTADRLIFRAEAYWWRQSGFASANRQTVRIKIPARNRCPAPTDMRRIE